MTRSRRVIASAVVLFALPAPAAPAWIDEVRPTVRVHDHTFDKVRVEANACELTITLWFDAPPASYGDAKNEVRNHYRFLARLDTKDGRSIRTKPFFNRRHGKRTYRTIVDTTAGGCWAKTKTQIVKLDVNACRGERCAVEPFK